MKKHIVIMTLAVITAILVICSGASGEEPEKTFSFGEFTGNETINAEPWDSGHNKPFMFFSKLFYLNGTLPEGLLAYDERMYISLVPAGQSDGAVIPDAGEIAFLSGDESLREAVCFDMDASGDVVMSTDLDARRTEPGEARFRVRLKAGGLYYENEYVFRLLSWDEYPLFDFVNPDHSGTAQTGEGPVVTDSFGNIAEYLKSSRNNTNLYSPAQIASLMVRDHSKEVMSRLLTEEEIHLYEETWNRAYYDVWPDSDSGSGQEWYPQENLWYGMSAERYYESDPMIYQFQAEGEYRFTFTMHNSNIQTWGNWIIRAVSYKLTGPSSLMPGETGIYQVQEKNESPGRTFTLSAEGEGISFDAGTGALTVPEDTPEGTEFTVTAVPSDGSGTVSLRGKVSTGLISSEEFRLINADGGFSIPLPADEEKYLIKGKACYTTDQSAPSYTAIRYNVYDPLDEFAEDGAVADKYYNKTDFSRYPECQTEDIALGEHHARAIVFRVPDDDGDYSVGYLLYARNNRLMTMDVNSIPLNGTSWEELPKVTMGDMRRLAEMIVYDPAAASITTADGAISLSSKEGTDVVTGGKKLTLIAAFASPDKVNRQAKNDTIEWSVTGADGAELPAGVKISGKGELSTGKTNEVVRVEVKAESPVFHTSGTMTVTILPAADKISVEPAEVWLYTGTDVSAEVRVVIEPDTVPFEGITWEAAKKDIIEIVPDPANGTAVIRALTTGKTNVQVKEPGGKNARLTVIAADPADSLELSVKGDAKPGSTVTITETVLPKQAGNKNVEWSLDVGEDIATISKGKVKIARTAPAGTVITVTCTAVGAPEPIVRTVRIEVAEK